MTALQQLRALQARVDAPKPDGTDALSHYSTLVGRTSVALDAALDALERERAELAKQLTTLRASFEKAPPEFDTDLLLASHYYGRMVHAIPVLDSAIQSLSA